jgi:hypothetical protein
MIEVPKQQKLKMIIASFYLNFRRTSSKYFFVMIVNKLPVAEDVQEV